MQLLSLLNVASFAADDPLQIALFYVANDVCQKAKKKANAHVLLQAFAPHWVNAIAYSRFHLTGLYKPQDSTG